MEGATGTGAVGGNLRKRRAGSGLGCFADVEVGIEIDDANHLVRVRCGKAAPGAVGGFVATTQHQREMPVARQLFHRSGQPQVGSVQIAIGTGHIAHIAQWPVLMPGQIGQRLADDGWCGSGTDTALIAPHAFVTGKADNADTSRQAGGKRRGQLVPAAGQFAFASINTTAPQLHIRVHLAFSLSGR